MVKDGEDRQGLQTTNLKSVVKLFKPFKEARKGFFVDVVFAKR